MKKNQKYGCHGMKDENGLLVHWRKLRIIMENDVVSILKEMTVDEQLAYINQLNDSSRTDDMESIIQSSMTDEDWFNYLVKQDKGIMTMEEFEQLGTKAIKELFG